MSKSKLHDHLTSKGVKAATSAKVRDALNDQQAEELMRYLMGPSQPRE